MERENLKCEKRAMKMKGAMNQIKNFSKSIEQKSGYCKNSNQRENFNLGKVIKRYQEQVKKIKYKEEANKVAKNK